MKKAEKAGVTTRLGRGRQDLELFLQLNLKLRRKHGMLPQPRRFFEAIWRHEIEAERGYVLFAERQGQTLAALLCLRQGHTTIDKFAVNDQAASQYRGSHAAMWSVIARETEQGTLRYDMGRSDAHAEGLHRFKEQWGAIKMSAPYFYYPKAGGASTEDPKGSKKRLLDTFARYAPDPVFKAAGDVIYRHLG